MYIISVPKLFICLPINYILTLSDCGTVVLSRRKTLDLLICNSPQFL